MGITVKYKVSIGGTGELLSCVKYQYEALGNHCQVSGINRGHCIITVKC